MSAAASAPTSSARFETLLKGGHLIDPANGRSALLDLAIAEGKVAAVDATIPAEAAAKVVDAGALMYDAQAITMPRWQDAPPEYWVCR